MSNENMNLTKVIVPCRFSYLHCWEPNAVNGGDPKYSGSLMNRIVVLQVSLAICIMLFVLTKKLVDMIDMNIAQVI